VRPEAPAVLLDKQGGSGIAGRFARIGPEGSKRRLHEQDFATSGLKSGPPAGWVRGLAQAGTAGPGIATVVDAAFVFGQLARDCGIPAGSDEFLGSGISYPPARSGRYR